MAIFNKQNKPRILAPIFSSVATGLQKIWTMAPTRDKKELPDLAHKNPRLDPINIIAKSIASTEILIYDKRDLRVNKDNAKPIEDHELYDLFEYPVRRYPEIDRYSVFYLTAALIELTGEFGWLKIRDQGGKILEIDPIPAAWVMNTPTYNNPYFMIYPYGVTSSRAFRVPTEDFVWFKRPNLVDPYGRGRGSAESIIDEVESDEYFAKMQKNLAYNDATPPLVISAEGITKEQAEAFKESWMQKLGGWTHRREPAVVPKSIEVTKLGMTPDEMDFIESRKFLRDESLWHYQIPPEIYSVIENSNRACYSSDTECLTKGGWKLYQDLSYDDDIATWDEEKNALVYAKPSKIVTYDYTGEMHHWKNKNVDVLVTPDHRMYTKTQFKGDFEIKRSYELADKKLQQVWRATGGNYSGINNTVKIPKVPYVGPGLRGEEPEGDAYYFDTKIFAKFLGFYISEGCLDNVYAADGVTPKSFSIRIGQNKGTIEQEIKDSMESLNIGRVTRIVQGPDKWRDNEFVTYSLCNKSLWYWLSENVKNGAYNKRIPRCVFDWDKESQEIFFDALMLGDGSKKQPRIKTTAKYADQFYATASIGLANDVQQLCVQIGLRSSIRCSTRDKFSWYVLSISSKQVYYINTSKIGSINKSPTSPIRKEFYDGVVWCLEIPTHVFFTRRNGKIACHGNTIDASYYLYHKNVLDDKYRFLERVINRQLIQSDFDQNLCIKFKPVVPEDEDRKLQIMNAGLQGGAVLVDEWRTAFNMQPLPNGKGQVLLRTFSTFEIPMHGNALPPPEKPAENPETRPVENPSEEVVLPETEGDKIIHVVIEKDEERDARFAAIWKSFDARARAHEGEFIDAVKKFSAMQKKKVVDALNSKRVSEALRTGNAYETEIDAAINGIFDAATDKALKSALAPAWTSTMKSGREHAREIMGKSIKDVDTSFDIFNSYVNEWIENFGLAKAQGINLVTNETLKRNLMAQIADAKENGETLREIKNRIMETCDGVYDEMDSMRAMRIARTESCSAQNFGSYVTGKSDGMTTKTWIATRDDRTRHDHSDVDGQTVGIDEKFVVGGSELDYPGDAACADAGEIVNCRCTIIYNYE